MFGIIRVSDKVGAKSQAPSAVPEQCTQYQILMVHVKTKHIARTSTTQTELRDWKYNYRNKKIIHTHGSINFVLINYYRSFTYSNTYMYYSVCNYIFQRKIHFPRDCESMGGVIQL